MKRTNFLRLVTPLFFTLFLFNTHVHAQKLRDLVKYDTLTYVYKLDNEQLAYLYKKQRVPDSVWFFTHKIDSANRFTFNKDSLGDGNFILANIIGHKLKVEVVTHYPFEYAVKYIQEERLLFLNDKETKRDITNARVWLNNRSSKYDNGFGAYALNTVEVKKGQADSNKYLHINLKGEDYYLLINENKVSQPYDYGKGRSRSSTSVSPGYMVLNKPKYKPGDTVRLKAYLLDRNKGKPIRKKVGLSLKGDGKVFWQKKIKKITKGAYVHEFIIPDSLKIDKEYTLKLNYYQGGVLFYQEAQFYLEDYVLAKNTYDLIMPKDTFYAGEEAFFLAKAADANGFPLVNARLQYKISIEKVFKTYADTMRFTNKDFKSWYAQDTIMSDLELTKVIIPETKLPNALIKFKIKATMIDDRMEKKEFTKYVYWDARKHHVTFGQYGDTVSVRHLYLLIDTAVNYDLLFYNGNALIDSQRITTPFSKQINFNYTQAQLKKENDPLKRTIVIEQNLLSLMDLEAQRTHDSIKVHFDFPMKIPVHYKLYKRSKENVEVASGQGNSFTYKARDLSKEDYYLLITSNLHGKLKDNFAQFAIRHDDKKLRIVSKMPSEIFPGHTMPLEIFVQDHDGTPLENINITAYSLSNLFKEDMQDPIIHLPTAPVKTFEYVPMGKGKYKYTIQSLMMQQNFNISNYVLESFNLKKNDFYKFYYPIQDTFVYYLPIANDKTEVAIVALNQHRLLAPHYVKANNELIYQGNIHGQLPYAHLSKAGGYNIDMRYFDLLLRINNIKTKKGYKTIVVVNMDSVLANKKHPFIVQDSLATFKMTPAEFVTLDEHSVFINGFAFDSLMVSGMDHPKEKLHYFKSRELGTVRVRDENFSLLTFPKGLNRDERILLEKGKEKYIIENNQNEVLYFYDKKFTAKEIKKVEEPMFPYSARVIYYENLLDSVHSLKVYDTKKEEVAKATQFIGAAKRSTRNNYQSPLSGYTAKGKGDSAISFRVSDTLRSHLVGFWIVSESSPKMSSFFASNYYNNKQYAHFGGSGSYDLYFLFKNKTIAKYDNVNLKAQDYWYVNTHFMDRVALEDSMLSDVTRLFNNLTKQPQRPFVAFPDEQDIAVRIVKKDKRSISFVRGTLKNNYGSKLAGIDVYLEQNGRFYNGATTNSLGEFEFLNIPKGKYMLKVFDARYQPRYAYNINIKTVAEYYYDVTLRDKTFLNPNLRINTNEVQLQIFTGKYNKLKSSAHIYDIETRKPLEGCTVRYVTDSFRTIEQNTTNFLGRFNLMERTFIARTCHVEITCKGYRKIILRNALFEKENVNHLKIFMKTLGTIDTLPMILDLQLEHDLNEKAADYKLTTIDAEYKGDGSTGMITGRVLDPRNKPLDYASIKLIQNGRIVGGAYTSDKGQFLLKDVKPGVYSIKVDYIGYASTQIMNLKVFARKKTVQNIKLSRSDRKLQEVLITSNKLIDATNPASDIKSGMELSELATTSVGDMVGTFAGVKQTASYSSPVSIGGSRADATQYFIDGVPVLGSRAVNLSPRALGSVQVKRSGMSAKYGNSAGGVRTVDYGYSAPSTASLSLMNATGAKAIRTNFSDVGFWEPNLVTDKNGRAYASVQFPDDITQWQTYIIAMGRGFKWNTKKHAIKSFKPIMTSSIVPRFLYVNDSLEAKAKFTKFDTVSRNMAISISQNDKTLLSKNINLNKQYIDSVWLHTTTTDSIKWKAMLDVDSYYKDGEEMKIPVFKSGLATNDYKIQVLDKDSTYTIELGENVGSTIFLNNSLLENILVELEKLKSYPYSCNEQKASKIKGLVQEEIIRKKLKQDFKDKRLLKSLINKLERSQKPNGAWSWWGSGADNHRMTIYITEVLHDANQLKYNNTASLLARDYIKKNINKFSTSDKLYAIYLLNKMSVSINYDQLMLGVEYSDLPTCDKLYYIRNQWKYKNKLDRAKVYDCLASLSGAGNRAYASNFFYDPLATFSLATKLLAGTAMEDNVLKSIKPLITSSNYISNSNTFSKVYLIEAWLRYMDKTNTDIAATINMNDSVEQAKFPIIYKTDKPSITLKHTGADVWLSVVKDIYVENPTKVDSLFDVRTHFVLKDKKVETLKKGQDINLHVDVMSFRTAKYVMVEVPIPAACTYKTKSVARGNISHIEYYKNKVVYYLDVVNVGELDFEIPLRVNFSGKLYLPPAKVSLMYYPHKSGNNVKRKIIVN